MARSVHRSAGSGRFVSNAAAARWPGKTTTKRVGSGTGSSRSGLPVGVFRAVRDWRDREAEPWRDDRAAGLT